MIDDVKGTFASFSPIIDFKNSITQQKNIGKSFKLWITHNKECGNSADFLLTKCEYGYIIFVYILRRYIIYA